jgi:hypothetical protein
LRAGAGVARNGNAKASGGGSGFPLIPATAPAITPNLLIFRGFSNKQPAFPAGITRGL